jgi:hypothetical protein
LAKGRFANRPYEPGLEKKTVPDTVSPDTVSPIAMSWGVVESSAGGC